jgi:hypothetical protein
MLILLCQFIPDCGVDDFFFGGNQPSRIMLGPLDYYRNTIARRDAENAKKQEKQEPPGKAAAG